jgi:hypothetical protein
MELEVDGQADFFKSQRHLILYGLHGQLEKFRYLSVLKALFLN